MTHGFAIIFSTKTGKVKQVLEGNHPMLKSYGMKMLKPSESYLVINDDNTIVFSMTGRQGNLPKINKEHEGKNSKEEFGIDVADL